MEGKTRRDVLKNAAKCVFGIGAGVGLGVLGNEGRKALDEVARKGVTLQPDSGAPAINEDPVSNISQTDTEPRASVDNKQVEPSKEIFADTRPVEEKKEIPAEDYGMSETVPRVLDNSTSILAGLTLFGKAIETRRMGEESDPSSQYLEVLLEGEVAARLVPLVGENTALRVDTNWKDERISTTVEIIKLREYFEALEKIKNN